MPTRPASAPVDRNDPTLDVDGLSEFLPPPLSQDPTLSVDELADLLPARLSENPKLAANVLRGRFADQPITTPTPVEERSASVPDPMLEVSGLKDYFGSRPIVRTEAVRKRRRNFLVVAERSTATHDARLMSATERAVVEFQRFAEKFHAFAAECQPALVPAWSQRSDAASRSFAGSPGSRGSQRSTSKRF
jgi:hypothetical protein